MSNKYNNIVATEQFVEEYVEDSLLEAQADWYETDQSSKYYIKNKTHYDERESGGELKKLDIKYLPDEAVVCTSAEVGQIIVVKSVNENGVPTEWEAVNGQTSQNNLILKDIVSGYEYTVFMENGSLTSILKLAGIKITNFPTKTDYTDTEKFDPTGMAVVAIAQDGSEKAITDYTYDTYVTTGSNIHTITYTEFGVEYTAEIPIITRTLEDALVDFKYTINEDGTYTITAWKGTYNGVTSTEMIVPNSPLIIIKVE